MNIVIAGNHEEFEQFLHDNYIYVGDRDTLQALDPSKVEQVYLVGNYDQHPFYWSDDLLQFQINMSIARYGVKAVKVSERKTLVQRIKTWFK